MINNPLEQFKILDLFSISILDSTKISFTNIGLYIATATILLLGLQLFCNYKKNLLSDRRSLVQESIYDSVLSIVKDQIGQNNDRFFPFILSLFLFILFSNLMGMIPYSFTPTSQIILTLSLSVAIFIGVTIIGFKIHKLTFFSLFIPVGTPLILVPYIVIMELISYFARALSLGIRLGANMISGHILLKILSTFIWKFITSGPIAFIIGFLPIMLFMAIVGLELAVAVVQATVFIILTSSYIRDAIYLH